MDRETTIVATLLVKGKLLGPELQKETGIPKTPFYAYLGKLQEKGVVERDESGNYELAQLDESSPPEEELRSIVERLYHHPPNPLRRYARWMADHYKLPWLRDLVDKIEREAAGEE